MNYKVLKRPMFRIGGGVDSQGTGITSGMDTPRQNYSTGRLAKIEDLFKQQREAYQGLEDYSQAAALGNLAQLFGRQTESNPLKLFSSVMTDPALQTDVILPGLKAKAKLKPTLLESEIKQETTLAELEAKQNKMYEFRAKMAMVDSNFAQMDAMIKADPKARDSVEYQRLERKNNRLLGEMSEMEFIMRGLLADEDADALDLRERWREAEKKLTRITGAEGGRVGLQESFPGTAGDAQQVMQPEQNMQGMTTGQDQAMTQDPYQILRRRLPPEVSDDVVRLIAYNKEAFQDFANIQTQDDVTMFNDKWGVQLVVDVGSA